jgi:hypothetical protein
VGAKSTPSVSAPGRPSSFNTVGTMSTRQVASVTTNPADTDRPPAAGPVASVVDEDAVRDFSVIPKTLAVIAGQDDRRALATCADRVEQPAHLLIRHRDLVVVPLDGASARRAPRVAVGRVRLEQVDPQEEAAAARVPQPGERFIDDLAARPFVEELPVCVARHPVAVEVEPSRDAEPPIERKRRHEGPGGEASLFEDACQHRHIVSRLHTVVPRTVTRRVAPRQQARVRGQRDGCRREGLVEPCALARQAIHCVRAPGRVAVRAHVIRPKRVDGNDDEILCGRLERGGRRTDRLGRPAACRQNKAGGEGSRWQDPRARRPRHCRNRRSCGGGRPRHCRRCSMRHRGRRPVPEPWLHGAGV